MADSDQTQEASIDWPDEIWAEETDGHGVGIYRTSHFAAISSEYEFARYVHGKVFDSLKRYHESMMEQLRAELAAITQISTPVAASQAAPQPVAVTIKQKLAHHRETFCLASPSNEAEFHTYLAGFDDATNIAFSHQLNVTVLPLVWDLSNARSAAGTYTFGRIGGEWWVRLKDCEIAEGHAPDFKLAEEAAKAAAQADYEALILAALTIQPADPLSDPRVKALVEELMAVEAHIKRGHLPDALNVIHAALRAIGGEA